MMKSFRSTVILMAIAAFTFLPAHLHSEEVTIIVTSIPSNTPDGSQIYVAGNFNSWDPGNPDFELEPNIDGLPQIVLEGSGTISFKFTRGSWATVEGNANGGFVPNRSFTFGTADTLEVTILGWEDTGGDNSTAAENVIIMDEAFYMPQFDRTRRIWLYLPPDYETSDKSYPVLYMHDGQNLFDQATAFLGEWEVDETLNELFLEGKEVSIVVGIDNGGGHRIAEYTPWTNTQYGGGDGKLYAEFVVETLKPYIDEHYRTLPGREHTAVMGSSLGGLISFYIAHKYQDVFSKAGIFSPSFWFSDSVYDFASETGKNHPMKYYLMAGSTESESMVPMMERMADTLSAIGFGVSELHVKVVPGGQHNEGLWAGEFRQAYLWLFDPQSTGFYHPANNEPDCKIITRGRTLFLKGECSLFDDKADLQLFSLSGRLVYSTPLAGNESIWIEYPGDGLYLARIISSRGVITRKLFLY